MVSLDLLDLRLENENIQPNGRMKITRKWTIRESEGNVTGYGEASYILGPGSGDPFSMGEVTSCEIIYDEESDESSDESDGGAWAEED